jgi:hypothetical protein
MMGWLFTHHAQIIWRAHRHFTQARIVLALTVLQIMQNVGLLGMVCRQPLHTPGLQHSGLACLVKSLFVAAFYGLLYMEAVLLFACIYQVRHRAALATQQARLERWLLRVGAAVTGVAFLATLGSCSVKCTACRQFVCTSTCDRVV